MPKRPAASQEAERSSPTAEAAHMDDARICAIVTEVLDFPDVRYDARTRHFIHLHEMFAAQYPALFAMCCSAGAPDSPAAHNVRRMLGMMLAHRAAGIRHADTPDNPASLSVRGALVRHYVVPALEAEIGRAHV